MLSVAISNEANVAVEYHSGVANPPAVAPNTYVIPLYVAPVGRVQDAWTATLLVFT